MTEEKQALLPVTPDDGLRGQILDIIHDTLEAEYVGTYIAGMDEAAGRIAALLSESQSHSLPGDVGMREAALVDAVRGALECLGTPDGYLADIGAPKTRALQRAFESYEPHPAFKKGY